MDRTRAPGRRSPRAIAALLAIAAAACSDRATPVTPPPPPGDGPIAPAITVQALECTASRTALTVSCSPAGPGGGPAQADIIVGNQNVYVKLTSTNVAYNAGTGQLTFDVTVQNLLEQKMGTVDGTTLAAGGIRVFFYQLPAVSNGTGTASVVPDGFATFTSAGQPYYQYNNVLANGATSPARGWTFIVAPTVTTFNFLLYVSAPVQYPNGYITLDGKLPGDSYGSLMHPGTTDALTAVVKNAVGVVIPGQVVTFSTTNPGCATVDGTTGLVTAVQAATCTVNATSGVRAGSLVFDVGGITRTWSGAVSADWNVGGNWGLGLVPVAADSVLIPTGVPNYPVLTGAATVSDVTVADNATLNVASFTLTSTGNVATGATAPSGILASGTGQLALAGTGKLVHGRFPRTLVSGTYSLDGTYEGSAPQTVDNGKITSENFLMRLTAQ
ncbi:MAG TPA: hypothetical protein VFJ16_27350 [Longimicrobium sp.]|nr:hypothetical protein [Longimicrobium sp.]